MLRHLIPACGKKFLGGCLLAILSMYPAHFAQAGHVATSCPALADWNFDLESLKQENQSRSSNAKEVQFLRKAMEQGFPVPRSWREPLRKIQGKPVGEQLLVVNALVNSIRYIAGQLH